MSMVMQSSEDAVAKTQRRYARFAGFLLLWLIVNGLGGGLVLSRIAGTGTPTETAARITASERVYRVALASQVIENLSAILLAFALYATLKPVNSFLAQLAMIFILEDTVLGLIVRVSAYVRLQLYTASQSAGTLTLVDLTRTIGVAAESVGGICFGIGSLVFFYLFLESRYIPRALSTIGVGVSLIWTCLYLASLVFPEQHTTFQYVSWPLMAAAEVTTGLYLTLFAVNSNEVSVQT